jgi:hypothetical protein
MAGDLEERRFFSYKKKLYRCRHHAEKFCISAQELVVFLSKTARALSGPISAIRQRCENADAKFPRPAVEAFHAARATFALNSVEKLRRLAMLWNPFSQAGFHLIALSDFRGPLLLIAH